MNPRFQDLVVTRWAARYRGLVLPCATGIGGIGIKQGEGDGKTPVGSWRIMMAYYRRDRMQYPDFPVPVQAIGPADLWSDDPRDPAYNHHIRSRRYPFSHERLGRSDPMYDIFAVLDFNWPKSIPGGGSAIFLHTWRKPRHPTAGCIAFAPEVLRYILQSWSPTARVVVPG